MEMKTSYLIFLALVLAVMAGVLLKISSVGAQYHLSQISTYADCAAAGNPILESYPSQCKTPDGRTFVNPNEQAGDAVDASTVSPTTSQQYVQSGCAVAGCSREICTEASVASGIVSPCVYLPQFACYKTARCERQGDGTCGWTMTAQLRACLQTPPQTNVPPMSN